MPDLVEWLTAQLDLDERREKSKRTDAKLDRCPSCNQQVMQWSVSYAGFKRDVEVAVKPCHCPLTLNDITRPNPDQLALDDIEAKRDIVETCAYYLHEYESGIDPCAHASALGAGLSLQTPLRLPRGMVL